MKHIKNPASHSKGLRVSSRQVRKTVKSAITIGPKHETNMRKAFIDSRITKSTGGQVVNQVAHVVLANSGVYKPRVWNASLSFKTAQMLGAPGFENPRMRTRYDDMCHTAREEE